MLNVLGRANSGNTQKVLCLLEEMGLPFEQRDYGGAYGGTQGDDYRRLNPNGTVPTLVDDGEAVWESNTILRYLAGRYGPTPLYPADPLARSHVERWMDWQLSVFGAAFGPLFHGLFREGKPLEALEAFRQKTEAHLALVERQLAERPCVAGNELTLADIALAPFVHRLYALDVPMPAMPHLRAWYERLAVRPAFARWVMVDF